MSSSCTWTEVCIETRTISIYIAAVLPFLKGEGTGVTTGVATGMANGSLWAEGVPIILFLSLLKGLSLFLTAGFIIFYDFFSKLDCFKLFSLLFLMMLLKLILFSLEIDLGESKSNRFLTLPRSTSPLARRRLMEELLLLLASMLLSLYSEEYWVLCLERLLKESCYLGIGSDGPLHARGDS